MLPKKAVLSLLIAIITFQIITPVAFANLLINEFSSTTQSDWVEIMNAGSEEIDLSDYRIRDTTKNNKVDLLGTLTPGSITSFSFGRSLNVDGDIVRLVFLDGEEEVTIDSIPYGTEGGVCIPSELGSIGRYPDANSTIERFLKATKDLSNDSAILDPCPTPTPEPTPSPSPTSKSTSTPAQTKTPAPTPTATVKTSATIKPSAKSVAKDEKDGDEVILGLREELKETPTASPEALVKGHFPLKSLLFILPGIGFIGYPVYLFLRSRQKGYTGKSEEDIKDS
jgi:hypothetical protein